MNQRAREQGERSGLAASGALARRRHATVNPSNPPTLRMVDGRTKLTNVKVYISLQKVGAGERVGMEGWSELEEGWRRRRGGVREEMPRIPLSGQRKTTERGEGRKRQKQERNTGNGGGEVEGRRGRRVGGWGRD